MKLLIAQYEALFVPYLGWTKACLGAYVKVHCSLWKKICFWLHSLKAPFFWMAFERRASCFHLWLIIELHCVGHSFLAFNNICGLSLSTGMSLETHCSRTSSVQSAHVLESVRGESRWWWWWFGASVCSGFTSSSPHLRLVHTASERLSRNKSFKSPSRKWNWLGGRTVERKKSTEMKETYTKSSWSWLYLIYSKLFLNQCAGFKGEMVQYC